MKNKSNGSKVFSALFATGILASCLIQQARAGVVVLWTQSGTDVIASYTGNWSLTATTPLVTSFAPPVHSVSSSDFYSLQPAYDVYVSMGVITAAPNTAISAGASSWSGDNFSYDSSGNIGLDSGYVTGSPISGSLTFSGTTLAAMFPSGLPANLPVFSQADDKANTVVFTTVPEASSAVMGISGLSLLLLRRRQRIA